MRPLLFAAALVATTAFLLTGCGQEGEVAPDAPPLRQPTSIAPEISPLATADDASPAPASAQEPQPTPRATGLPLPFETIDLGQHSGFAVQQPQVIKIETQAQWEEFWSRHQSAVTPAPPLPVVDFSTQMVIVVVDRQQPSGGYGLEITGLEVAGQRLAVRARRDKPDEGCIVGAVITQPFHIVRVTTRWDQEPALVISEATFSCG